MIVTSDGMDELSTRRLSHIFDVQGKTVKRVTIDPQKLGFKRPDAKELLGGDAKTNAKIIRAILSGEKGPQRDIAVLNAGAALFAAGKAETIAKGITLAQDSVDRGNAVKVLNELITQTNSFK